MQTRIFWSEPTVRAGNIVKRESELEFIKWTPKNLIVKFPSGSNRACENWKMGRKLVNKWLIDGRLRIEGDIPEWALII